jgi:hypothetical protein
MVSYRMLARDINSAPLQYRCWIVPNTPDFTGQFYTGPKSGSNDLVDVSAYVVPDNSVFNFNLPEPTIWHGLPIGYRYTPFDFPGMQVLPEQVSDSQIVVIHDGYGDGYIYLFGSKISDKIYQASINNPAIWVDTGATLPTALYGSSLAVVNDTIYLFGGNDGYGSVNTIFSASVSDPLTWTQMGTLPVNLESSSLGMADGYLYLFGGLSDGAATADIYIATTSSPLSWSSTGTLPVALYGSTIAQSQGSWYLLGGQLSALTNTSHIYTATVVAPTAWTQAVGQLPYPTSYGQFFTVGSQGYYMGPSPGDAGTGFTTILQCSIGNLTRWTDTLQIVPAVLSHSQTAIICDRLWFFGGSGLSAIFACEQILKYSYTDPTVISYGNITRTVFQSTDNVNEPFLALGIPYWKTDFIL